MTRHKLARFPMWFLLSSASLLIGCESTTRGTAPTVHADPGASPGKSAGHDVIGQQSATFTADLGHVIAKNDADVDRFATYIVWDYADGVNQIDVAHSEPTWVDRHTSADITIRVDVDPCKVYQPDVYWNLPKQAHYTMSDVGNYKLDAPGKLAGPQHHCRTAPPPCTVNCDQPPPPPPGCVVNCGPPPPPPPQCTGRGDAILFPNGEYPIGFLAGFPIGFPAPWLPSGLGPFSFHIPAGVWDIAVMTGDRPETAMDAQTDEQVDIELIGASVTIGPTIDVPETLPRVQSTVFHGVVLPSDVTALHILHANPYPSIPSGSLYVSSLSYACPGASAQRVLR
jgi:hypothetical protein